MLMYHQKDKRLCSAFCQFKVFAYQTMMTKSKDEDSRWPGFLTKKDCNLMIRLWFKKEIEQQYDHKVQKLCKTPGFGLMKSNQPRDLDQESLENVVFEVKDIALMINSLMLSIGPISRSPLTSHLASMKLLAMFINICRSAHQNNSNYILLLMTIYIYLAGAKVDAITLLN